MRLTWRGIQMASDTACCVVPVIDHMTDTMGRLYSFTYDSRGDLATVTDPFQRQLVFSHNTFDQLQTVGDPLLRRWAYAYDGSTRHVTAKTDPDGRTFVHNTYNATDGTVRQQYDAFNSTYNFTISPYVAATVTDPVATTTSYNLNSCGVHQTFTSVGTFTLDYNTGCDLTGFTDSTGSITTYKYDASHNLYERDDPLVPEGQPVWTFSYDSQKNLRIVIDPLGYTTERTYDPTTNVILTEKRMVDNSPTYATTTYAYGDPANKLRPTLIQSPQGYGVQFQYDTSGNLRSVTNPDGNVIQYTPDSFGRLTTTTDPEQHSTVLHYDSTDRMYAQTDPLGNDSSFGFDGAGNLQTATDRNGNQTSYTPDADSVLWFVQQKPDPVGQPTLIYTTRYQRDANGNVNLVTDANNHSRDNTYDVFNNLASTKERNTKSAGVLVGDLITRYTRDARGRVQYRDNPDYPGNPAARTTYTYDTRGQVRTITAGSLTVSFTYDKAGNRRTMTDSTGQTTYDYYGFGRLKSVTYANGDVVSYTYWLDGLLHTVTYPGAGTVTYDYTASGRLWHVTDWAGRATTYSYRPSGLISSVLYPNGMLASYGYDNVGRVNSVANTKAGSTISSHAYTLDNVGNRKTLTEFVSGITIPNTTDGITYDYDGLSRLKAFTYDGVSNVSTRTNPSASYAYDDADRVQSDGSRTFSWNAADQMTARGADGFNWDPLGRMSGSTVAGSGRSYAYDGGGLLRSRTESGTTTNYTWDVNASVPPLMAVGTNRVINGAGPLYIVHADGTTATLARDALGSVRAEVSDSGAVSKSFRYAAYGDVLESTGGAPTVLGFAGELRDPSGMVYLRARWYDPAMGRFISRDVVGGINVQPATLNGYVYGLGNPVLNTDPSGMWVFGICDSASAGLGFFRLFVSASLCVTVDQAGEIGATATIGPGVTSGVEAGLGVGILFSQNADEVGELGGLFDFAGATVLGLGITGDVAFGESNVHPGKAIVVFSFTYSRANLDLLPSRAALYAIHGGTSNTATASSGINVRGLLSPFLHLIGTLQSATAGWMQGR